MNFDQYQQNIITSNNDMLVIAGPGSGKTTTIIGKVKYLLENNKDISILMLSFTNKSVEDISNRINNENVYVTTFHKLACDILKIYNLEYQICDIKLLPYIIDEYIETLDKKNKNRLCRYLNILKLNKYSNEYKSFKNLIITFINLFKTNNHDMNIILLIIIMINS